MIHNTHPGWTPSTVVLAVGPDVDGLSAVETLSISDVVACGLSVSRFSNRKALEAALSSLNRAI